MLYEDTGEPHISVLKEIIATSIFTFSMVGAILLVLTTFIL